MNKATLAVLALLLMVAGAMGQTPSVKAAVNIGNPSWATFYMTGGTQVIIQCAYSRGFYITNFDVYGEQQETVFSIPGCAVTSGKNAAGQNTLTYTMLGPATFTAGSQTVTLDSASWTAYEHSVGRGTPGWSIVTGSAIVTVQP